MNQPMDIIILAGQSNAVGYGLGEASYQLKHMENAYLLYDNQPEDYARDENGKEYMAIYKPWKITLVEAQKGYTGSLAMRFADGYIAEGYLQPGRKLLIVRCAVGGTGFAKNLWGTGELLQERMLDLTAHALSLHPENRVVALLWHQGECDAFENPEFDFETRKAYYHSHLKEMVQNVRNHCNQPKLPFLCGGFTDEWSNKGYREQCDAVIAASKQVCEELGYGAFADTTGLASNNQLTGNGDDIHFCKESVYEIGRRYFENFKRIVGE